jgi:aldehyde dehydrogenase (NAD+)
MADHGVSGLQSGRGPAGLSEALIADERLPLISLQARRRLAAAWHKSSWRFGGRFSAHGNNAIIVTEDARQDLALRAIVFGAVGTAGQRCTTRAG